MQSVLQASTGTGVRPVEEAFALVRAAWNYLLAARRAAGASPEELDALTQLQDAEAGFFQYLVSRLTLSEDEQRDAAAVLARAIAALEVREREHGA